MINITLSSLKSLGQDSGTHFFGSPMLTKKLAKTKFNKEELFVGQINLSEIKPFDKEDLLPDSGMLYVFFDVFARTYSLFYTEDEPTEFIEGFNKKLENFRYDNALSLGLRIPKDKDEENEVCTKMLAPLPESVSALLNYPDEFVCLFTFIPSIMDDLGRPFLMKIKECSCVLIKKKHLEKRKFHKAITINV